MFVEFANVLSADRALKLASSKKAFVAGKKLKIFKAGSGTFVYQKSRKNKIRGMSETNIFNVEK